MNRKSVGIIDDISISEDPFCERYDIDLLAQFLKKHAKKRRRDFLENWYGQ